MQAIAPRSSLQITGIQTVQAPSGYYTTILEITALVSRSETYYAKPHIFRSPPERTTQLAEEGAVVKALQFYLGSPSIPALDLLYKSSLTGQQRAHENRQDNNNMVAWAQQQQ